MNNEDVAMASSPPRRKPGKAPQTKAGQVMRHRALTPGPIARRTPIKTGDVRSDVCEIQYIDEERIATAQRAMKPDVSVVTLAETLKVLGDPTRVRITWALAQEELCVCDLARLLRMSPSAVSHSLRALRQLRIVACRKTGKIAYYRLDDEHVSALLRDGFRHIEQEGA